ncbi:MAG: hypothetical protein IJQ28_08660 [Clostridia bacterium]|nr:hypothetical protein [Clostridia bacterium]
MVYYEIATIYSKDCADVIYFQYNGLVCDENDIVSQAIKMGFLGEENRKQVRWARSVSEFEFEHLK